MHIDIIISNFGYVSTRMFTARERKAYPDSATKEENVFCVLKMKQQVVPKSSNGHSNVHLLKISIHICTVITNAFIHVDFGFHQSLLCLVILYV